MKHTRNITERDTIGEEEDARETSLDTGSNFYSMGKESMTM